MVAQVWCEKNKDVKGGGKLKESHFKLLLINSSLLIESICTQICGENSVKRMGKTGLVISKNLGSK